MDLTIIPTRHNSEFAWMDVSQEIITNNPDFVTLELNNFRYQKLIGNDPEPPKVNGLLSGVYIKAIQKALSQGSSGAKAKEDLSDPIREIIESNFDEVAYESIDSTSAIHHANETDTPIHCIDQPIIETLENIVETTPRIELYKFVLQSFIAGSLNQEPEHTPQSMQELEELEEGSSGFKKAFPHIEHALIDHRNEYMAEQLFKLQEDPDNQHGIVVVGARHAAGLRNELEEDDAITVTVRFENKNRKI